MEQFVIEVKNVSKSFKGIPVLNDINITCRSGKIYGIIGYNGSGKTVLFKCICGFLHVDSGEISVNGRVMGKEMDMLEHAGIIIEEPGYIRNLSGYRNLEYLYRITHKKDPAVIHSIMLKVGLDPQSRKKVCHYSLGMRQRLAIAQATMEDQAILILDEPMNGLDREGVAEMRKFFLEQKEMGKLILLASHNKDDIELLCDEVYEMNHGILAMYSKST
ncbi:ABC transporter ATP-binding protein [uncultured Acetatifactor sp.]|uniref:ABC transporter ATP-binding protein n=1 Tax=uncultured Acetatifactor sp. TaxID=1671927 RepID=UPI002625A534|nr:ATP-binding cassette domain-containing protein [uncultured Acetatifactor sp.]